MSDKTAAELLPDLDLTILNPTTCVRQTRPGRYVSGYLDSFIDSYPTLRAALTAFAAEKDTTFDDLLDADASIDREDDELMFKVMRPETDQEFADRVRKAHELRLRQLDESLRQSTERDRDNHDTYVLIAKILAGKATDAERQTAISYLRSVRPV